MRIEKGYKAYKRVLALSGERKREREERENVDFGIGQLALSQHYGVSNAFVCLDGYTES